MHDNSKKKENKTWITNKIVARLQIIQPEKTFKLESVGIISGTRYLYLHAFFRVRILV